MHEFDLGQGFRAAVTTDLGALAQRRLEEKKLLDSGYNNAVSYLADLIKTTEYSDTVFEFNLDNNFLGDNLIPEQMKNRLGLLGDRISGSFTFSRVNYLAKFVLRNQRTEMGLGLNMILNDGRKPYEYSFTAIPGESYFKVPGVLTERGILTALIASKFAEVILLTRSKLQPATSA